MNSALPLGLEQQVQSLRFPPLPSYWGKDRKQNPCRKPNPGHITKRGVTEANDRKDILSLKRTRPGPAGDPRSSMSDGILES